MKQKIRMVYHWLESKLKTRNIPTKQITLIYNNEIIESYE